MLCDYIALMFFYVIISLLIYYGISERRGVETNAATIHSSSLFAITVLSHLLRMFFCLIYFTVPGLLGMCSSFSVAQRLVHSRVSYIFLLRNLRCHVYGFSFRFALFQSLLQRNNLQIYFKLRKIRNNRIASEAYFPIEFLRGVQ